MMHEDAEGRDGRIIEPEGVKEQSQTKRILKAAEQSKSIAVDNLTQIVHQGEQLERAEKSVDNINQNLTLAGWFQRGLEGVSGTFYNYLTSAPLTTKNVDTPETSCDESGWEIIEEDVPPKIPQPPTRGRPKNDFDKQVEMDNDLEQIASVVSNLKVLSRQSKKELERQSDVLDKLSDNTVATKERVDQLHQRIVK